VVAFDELAAPVEWRWQQVSSYDGSPARPSTVCPDPEKVRVLRHRLEGVGREIQSLQTVEGIARSNRTRFCAVCGSRAARNDNFCVKCGTPVNKAAVSGNRSDVDVEANAKYPEEKGRKMPQPSHSTLRTNAHGNAHINGPRITTLKKERSEHRVAQMHRTAGAHAAVWTPQVRTSSTTQSTGVPHKKVPTPDERQHQTVQVQREEIGGGNPGEGRKETTGIRLVMDTDSQYFLTESQRANEAELHGPFAGKYGFIQELEDLISDDKFDQDTVVDHLWKYMGKEVEGKQVTVKVFTQFMHFLAMRAVSKAYKDGRLSSEGPFSDLLEKVFGGDLSKFKLDNHVLAIRNFELLATLVDKVVPELAPDLFRLIDTNNDGTITEEELKRLISTFKILTQPDTSSIEREKPAESVLFLIFTVLDKDKNEIVEPEEISDFAKKMVHLAANVLKTVFKAFSTTFYLVVRSYVVDQIFQDLDEDGDGRLTIEEITGNFDHKLLDLVKMAGLAAPILHEIRAPQYEAIELKRQIEFLKTKGASLDGFESSSSMPDYRCGKIGRGLLREEGRKPSLSQMAFLSRALSKVISILPSIGMTTSYDKNSFFVAFKKVAVQHMNNISYTAKDFIDDAFGDEYKQLYSNAFTALIDDINDTKVDEVIRALSDAIFNMLDSGKTGKVSPTGLKVYTDFFFKECPDDKEAKKRLTALFKTVDSDPSDHKGSLSKQEMILFFEKLKDIAVALALVLIEIADSLADGIGPALEHLMTYYLEHRKTYDFVEDAKFDKTEFRLMVTSGIGNRHASWIATYFHKAIESMEASSSSEDESEEGEGEGLYWSIKQEQRDDLLNLLAAFGSKVNGRDDIGRTALHRKSQEGDSDMVQCLLKIGADVSAADLVRLKHEIDAIARICS